MNDLKTGNLSGKYLGIMDWATNVNVPTMNVYHEWHKGPIATFHHSLAITFKPGISWYPDDMKDLIELHKQWNEMVEKEFK